MFEMADGGTILLDEIGDMDIRLQAKLLQVLQDHEFQRIGGKETITVDVRVMAATHRDLEQAHCRPDLPRGSLLPAERDQLGLPPLRERTEDIIPMAEFLMQKHAVQASPLPPITAGLKHAMMTYHWPGNVRELENFVRKFLILRDPDMLGTSCTRKLSASPWSGAASANARRARSCDCRAPPILEQVTRAKQQAETDAILAALNSTRWNRKQAAALLKIDYKALLYKMKKLGVEDKPAAFAGADSQSRRTATGD